jgi:hypothetical protein
MLKRKTRSLLLTVIIAVLLVTTVVAFVKISKIEKTKDLGVTAFEIGMLNAEDGKEAKSDFALRSSYQKADKFNKITLAEDADVTYQIFYFNADKKFIGKSNALSAETTELTKTFTVSGATENVRYYRVVVIVPDTKDEVTILNMGTYLKQITVTVNK